MSLIDPIPFRILRFVVNHKGKFLIGLFLIVIFILIMQARSCFRPAGRLNEEEIQKGEQAIRERNEKELRNILTNTDVRAAEINENAAYAETERLKVAANSRAKWSNANIEELRQEFERRK